MQHVRLYLNDQGEVEHTETSTKPLRDEPAIEVVEPIMGTEGMTEEQIRAIPTRKRHLDHIMLDLETSDGKFKRAREVMDSIEVRKSDLRVTLKAQGKVKGQIMNHRVIRASRGQQ